ncbi:hypothetical protein L195_g047285 [Trifolium pratense]|uniref:Uncharacterized protein n=1 Tax=Trifolium pratense TaxID=57577 RepID=A0A2K3MK77_TRIPR|nr:hypothetical protein L195_g047285 [Trifolium pratense]
MSKECKEKKRSLTPAPGQPRRKWSDEVHQLPQFMHEYIEDVTDMMLQSIDTVDFVVFLSYLADLMRLTTSSVLILLLRVRRHQKRDTFVYKNLKLSHGGIIVEDNDTRPKIVVDLDLVDNISCLKLLISPKITVIVMPNQF